MSMTHISSATLINNGKNATVMKVKGRYGSAHFTYTLDPFSCQIIKVDGPGANPVSEEMAIKVCKEKTAFATPPSAITIPTVKADKTVDSSALTTLLILLSGGLSGGAFYLIHKNKNLLAKIATGSAIFFSLVAVITSLFRNKK
jgi:hypothetical protein